MELSLYGSVAIVVIFYALARVVYRLTLHPLAKVPGPKLAASTQLYQTFYGYHGGRSDFYQQVERLHKQYGPVVRITPDEVSLSDPDAYDKIYHVGTKYYKSPSYYRVFGSPSATFTTIHNAVHASRRSALNPFFSRKAVLHLEPLIQDKAAKLVQRLAEGLKAGCGSVELHCLFSALSVDVTSDYVFHDCYNLLENHPSFGHDFANMVRGVLKGLWVFMQSKRLEAIMLRLPRWLSDRNTIIRKYNKLVDETKANVVKVKRQVDAGELTNLTRRSIFHELLAPSDNIGQAPTRTVDELTDEGLSIMVAAALATGNALTMIAFHVLRNPDIYRRLREEIQQEFADPEKPMNFLALEKLPYLTGVIREGLRLSYGVIGRLPRVVPDPGAEFNGHFLPAGSVVGMSSWIMHRNPGIFPDPECFNPERWLDPVKGRKLSRYLVSFGKDSRQCIGMPLAYCELYVTTAMLFRKYGDLELDGTKPEDLVYDDYFSAFNPETSRGMRVRRISES
ncbi:trichodiene oxygenase [Aspergillus udagawae]|nr:trichodiene oxygenase [Aspergillus udagawae]